MTFDDLPYDLVAHICRLRGRSILYSSQIEQVRQMGRLRLVSHKLRDSLDGAVSAAVWLKCINDMVDARTSKWEKLATYLSTLKLRSVLFPKRNVVHSVSMCHLVAALPLSTMMKLEILFAWTPPTVVKFQDRSRYATVCGDLVYY